MDYEVFKEYVEQHFAIAYAAQQIVDLTVNKGIEIDEDVFSKDIINNLKVFISDEGEGKSDRMSVYRNGIQLASGIDIGAYYKKLENGAPIEVVMILLVIEVTRV